MITKRVNTDLFLNLLFKDKLTNQNINYSGANKICLSVSESNMTTLLSDDYSPFIVTKKQQKVVQRGFQYKII